MVAQKSTESACNAGDLGSVPGLGVSPGGGHGSPLQYSYLENPMDRGAWWATVHGVTKICTQLSDLAWMVNSMTRGFEIFWEPAKRFLNCPMGIRECPKGRNC